MLYTSLILVLLIGSGQAIPAKFKRWPTLRGVLGGGSIRAYTFVQYKDSCELCQEFFQPWWEDFLVQRRSVSKSLQHNKLAHSYFADLPWPAPETRYRSPTQSIQSALGGKRVEGVGPEGQSTYSRSCYTVCEDIRPDAELFLTYMLDVSLQVRDKGEYQMECPVGYYMTLVWVKDLRGKQSPLYDELDKQTKERYEEYIRVKQLKEFGRNAPPGPPYPAFPPTLAFSPRAKNGYVQKCKCRRFQRANEVSERTAESDVSTPSAVSLDAAMSDVEQETVFASFTTDSPPMLIFRDSLGHANHPYADAAVELSDAVTFWTNQFDCIDME